MRARLISEINNPVSPVGRYFNQNFTAGLRAVQHRARYTVAPLTVPAGVHPGTVGTAARWLLRFLLHARPDLSCAVRGARLCASAGLDVMPALADLADQLAVPLPEPGGPGRIFPGPAPGTRAEPDLLARACWALALLSDISREVAFVPALCPRNRTAHVTPTGHDLLMFAPPAALEHLSCLREVFEQHLIPRLVQRTGPWALEASFTSSPLITAEADVVAAGLLLNLTTSATGPAPGVPDMFEIIGCALLDFDDTYRLNSVGHFGTRHRHLVIWDLDALLTELAGTPVQLPALRSQFRTLLHSYHAAERAPRHIPPPGRPPKATHRRTPTRL